MVRVAAPAAAELLRSQSRTRDLVLRCPNVPEPAVSQFSVALGGSREHGEDAGFEREPEARPADRGAMPSSEAGVWRRLLRRQLVPFLLVALVLLSPVPGRDSAGFGGAWSVQGGEEADVGSSGRGRLFPVG